MARFTWFLLCGVGLQHHVFSTPKQAAQTSLNQIQRSFCTASCGVGRISLAQLPLANREKNPPPLNNKFPFRNSNCALILLDGIRFDSPNVREVLLAPGLLAVLRVSSGSKRQSAPVSDLGQKRRQLKKCTSPPPPGPPTPQPPNLPTSPPTPQPPNNLPTTTTRPPSPTGPTPSALSPCC